MIDRFMICAKNQKRKKWRKISTFMNPIRLKRLNFPPIFHYEKFLARSKQTLTLLWHWNGFTHTNKTSKQTLTHANAIQSHVCTCCKSAAQSTFFAFIRLIRRRIYLFRRRFDCDVLDVVAHPAPIPSNTNNNNIGKCKANANKCE